GHPEGGAEAFANFLQALGKAQAILLGVRVDFDARNSGEREKRGQRPAVHTALDAQPAAIVSESYGVTWGFFKNSCAQTF
ncbi:MAG TPA: hypothetical protein VGH17_06920, partial [Candidatus Acidoferrales bacterium]